MAVGAGEAAELPDDEFATFSAEVTVGDHDQLLRTAMRWFEVV